MFNISSGNIRKLFYGTKHVAQELKEVRGSLWPRSFEDIKHNVDSGAAQNHIRKELASKFKIFLKETAMMTERYVLSRKLPLILLGLGKYTSMIRPFFGKKVNILGEIKVDVSAMKNRALEELLTS